MFIAPKRTLVAALVAAAALAPALAHTLHIDSLHIAGPYTMPQPLCTDTADVWFKPFDTPRLLFDRTAPAQLWLTAPTRPDSILPAQEQPSVSLAGFKIDCNLFAKCKIVAHGGEEQKVYIDGREGAEQNLTPGRHWVVVKVRQKAHQADTLRIALESEQTKHLCLYPQGPRRYTLDDYLHGERASRIQLSSTGRYLMLTTSITRNDGQVEWVNRLTDQRDGHQIPAEGFLQWAEQGDRYIRTRKNNERHTIYEYVHPATAQVEHLFTDYDNRGGILVAHEQMLLSWDNTEGPKDDPKVHQILEPDDRIPGWRNRSNAQLTHLATGQTIALTQGQHDVGASISPDGTQALVTIYDNCITERPFTFRTVLLVDLATMQADTLVRHDGFVDDARFSPSGHQVAFSGSPQAFDGIGQNDPTGKIPSMTQTELFLMDLSTRQVRSLTRDFNPSITKWEWSRADGRIYALCQNRDRNDIFCLDLETGQWQQLQLTENAIASFHLAAEKPLMAYIGQSQSNSDRAYTVDLRSGREHLVRDLSVERLEGIELGQCHEWNFQSSRGDSITGRYYLPPHFDPAQQYPMLVYYYGGCSPVGRQLDSYYNFNHWAAMGYVVYVLQPSGCTGFGQEFAARHVNAWGKYTAQDIIEGTQQFCQEHPYVNSKKIGCLGASYGGFTTMYLLTQTSLFAAAMSHAGISNPASYWGFGYWGYSYNAIAAANSYPWTDAELYSLNSPLFNAHKVTTPILFLHGEADTNVPIAESVQMFNALKILGRECAFVAVEGQNHHILDYEKRRKWIHTYYAWFARWLQDDPTWWNTLYPQKNLK